MYPLSAMPELPGRPHGVHLMPYGEHVLRGQSVGQKDVVRIEKKHKFATRGGKSRIAGCADAFVCEVPDPPKAVVGCSELLSDHGV
jgi:hypothetical protein